MKNFFNGMVSALDLYPGDRGSIPRQVGKKQLEM